MWLRKHATPGSASGGFTWDSPEHVVEVPDHIGEDLLRIGGFEIAEAPIAEPEGDSEPEDDDPSGIDSETDGHDEADEPPASAEVVEAPAVPRRRGGRKPAASPVSE